MQADGVVGARLPRPALPRQAYARTFEALTASLPARAACRTMVGILALAHEQACEAELANRLATDLEQGRLPNLTELRAQFVPDARAMPEVMVTFIPLAAYEELGTVRPGAAA